MEYSPSRHTKNNNYPEAPNHNQAKMSMLAMAHPTPHAAFKREFAWEDSRQFDLTTLRPRTDGDRIALPSIRQAIPELQLPVPSENARGASPSTTSPVVGRLGGGASTPPEYVHSPLKRRRLSSEDEQEERARQIPRLYNSPSQDARRHAASQGPSSVAASRGAADGWTNSSRTSPYLPPAGLAPPMRSPVAVQPMDRTTEPRPTLPSLPLLSFDRAPASLPPRARGHSSDEYLHEAPRQIMMHPNGAAVEVDPAYRPAGFAYGYHHPSRSHSISLGSIHPLDRTPFSAPGYGAHYPEYTRMGELSGMNLDNKQRKRRGNLPKETTDKLRAWFVAHLHHPYPTEDEKQDLMKQTGLQMNQISNWFINARRRQLPNMINNARAESDAISARSGEAKVLPSTERVEYDDSKPHSPLSDDNNYDDVFSHKPRRNAGMKRGSV